MAQTQHTGNGARALILIDMRATAEETFDQKVDRLRRVNGVVWSHPVKQIRRLDGEKTDRPFTGLAKVQVADSTELDRTIEYIHDNFSHIEAYEF